MATKNTKDMNLFEKLSKIRASVEVLQKNKKGFNYKYVSEDEILAKITANLKTYNVDFYPAISPGTTTAVPISYIKTKVLKDGKAVEEHINETLVQSDMVYEWINLDNPEERYQVPWALVGQQADASQAFGSGLTYTSRYFLMKFFKCATSEDDPDNFRKKQREAEEENKGMVAGAIIEEVDKLIKSNITDDNKVTITDLVKSVAKNKEGKPTANYLEIKDPEMASALFDKLKEFFNK